MPSYEQQILNDLRRMNEHAERLFDEREEALSMLDGVLEMRAHESVMPELGRAPIPPRQVLRLHAFRLFNRGGAQWTDEEIADVLREPFDADVLSRKWGRTITAVTVKRHRLKTAELQRRRAEALGLRYPDKDRSCRDG